MGCFYTRLSKRNDEEDTAYDMRPIQSLPVIFVNGVPGAGNYTVAETISNLTGYTMIKPGELVRTEAQSDTPRGRTFADRLRFRVELPAQLTVDLIKEEMLRNQDANGFILVGFPRSTQMSNIFSRQVKWPEKVVALEVDNDVAAQRLQSKLSEVGRPESELKYARHVVNKASFKVKNVHRRFGNHVVTLNSSDNPKVLASNLKEILSETIDKFKKREVEPPTVVSAPACFPDPPTTFDQKQKELVIADSDVENP